MIPFSVLAAVLVVLGVVGIGIHGADALSGYQINCGASGERVSGNVTWVPDGRFIGVGNATDIPSGPGGLAMPMLSSLRYFPDTSARKYCYVVPAVKAAKYLVRTTYYYGGFDGGEAPPVFDQIIEGTRWSQVDTAADYAGGRATYFEAVVAAAGKEVSVCLARNAATSSSPFISALEVVPLEDSVYNSTDFSSYALSTIARHSFGHDGSIFSDPADQFNRYWEPYSDGSPVVESQGSVATGAFWNRPPEDGVPARRDGQPRECPRAPVAAVAAAQCELLPGALLPGQPDAEPPQLESVRRRGQRPGFLPRPERLDGGVHGVRCPVAALRADEDHADARAGVAGRAGDQCGGAHDGCATRRKDSS